MIHPRIDELMEQVDSRYALVIVAAKRARQINNYHHQLGEGTFDEFAPPLIESRSKNYLTMALEEIAEGKIVYSYAYPQGSRSALLRYRACSRSCSVSAAGSPRTRRAS